MLDRFAHGGIGLVRFGEGLASAAAIRGVEELFHRNGVRYRILSRREARTGQMADKEPHCLLFAGDLKLRFDDLRLHQARLVLTGIGLPVTMCHPRAVDPTIVPVDFSAVYVDQEELTSTYAGYELCPDIALALDRQTVDRPPTYDRGLFMGQHESTLNLGDPVELCETVDECRDLFAHFAAIITDSPRFAGIAASLERNVVLLISDGDTGKARLYENAFTIARSLDEFAGIEEEASSVREGLYRRLCGAPSRVLPFDSVPLRREGLVLHDGPTGKTLRDGLGNDIVQCDDSAAFIWRLCGGSLDIGEMVEAISEEYREPLDRIARDVQTVLRKFISRGIIELEPLRSDSHDREADEAMRAMVNPPLSSGTSSKSLQLFIRKPAPTHGKIIWSARLRCESLIDEDIWFEYDETMEPAVTPRADPFLLASLYFAMRHGLSLWVRGAGVSASLIERLDEFQQAWCAWSNLLRYVEISAEEIEDRGPLREKPAILAFSGGVDSCYSVYRHVVEPDRYRKRRLTAALMVHGFDVPWVRDFKPVLERGRRVLCTTPLELVVMRTNIKRICRNWDSSHALGLAAGLTLFGERFGSGLIASTMPYNLVLSHGSNPITDWMMGSRYFEVLSDATAVTRIEKIRSIVGWPAARRHVRFCWKDKELGNCGHCAKCLLTAILFRALGDDPSDCFGQPITDESIAERLSKVRFGRLELFDARMALQEARLTDKRFDWEEPLRALTG